VFATQTRQAGCVVLMALRYLPQLHNINVHWLVPILGGIGVTTGIQVCYTAYRNSTRYTRILKTFAKGMNYTFSLHLLKHKTLKITSHKTTPYYTPLRCCTRIAVSVTIFCRVPYTCGLCRHKITGRDGRGKDNYSSC
jgi:hypothetical protein